MADVLQCPRRNFRPIFFLLCLCLGVAFIYVVYSRPISVIPRVGPHAIIDRIIKHREPVVDRPTNGFAVRTADISLKQAIKDKYSGVRSSKWIVLTTIQAPTEQVRALGQIPGWQLLVIGDTKTPKDWSDPNAIYLDMDDQLSLSYDLVDLIPTRRYTRKSLGYLFAIEHGAEFIYETDDDNVPIDGLASFFMSSGQTSAMVIDSDQITYNPCRHFGQSTLWPRGYPLDRIGTPDPRDYRLATVPTPVVQQGFVNGDPDLDAVYRLTRKHGTGPLDMKFDGSAPPVVLPAGTFAPMNSQNTLFHKRGFWALLLPTTVTDRVTDIYRSYWGERLLWLIGERVAFFPPNAYQARSPHSYISDAKMEFEMYENTGKLLEFLNEWSCSKFTLPECVNELSSLMAERKFWRPLDAELVATWLADLASIGYEFPPLASAPPVDADFTSMVFYPNEQNSSWMYNSKYLLPDALTNHKPMSEHVAKICNTNNPLEFKEKLEESEGISDVILVVGLRSTDSLPNIDVLHKIKFPNIVYCGKDLKRQFFHRRNLTYIDVQNKPNSYSCLKAASRMGHINKGYFYIPDDTLLLDGQFSVASFSQDVPWIFYQVIKAPNMTSCFERNIRAVKGDSPVYLPKHMSMDKITLPKSEHLKERLLPVYLACVSQKYRSLVATQTGDQAPDKTAHCLRPYDFSRDTTDSDRQHMCNYFKQL